jgi:EAL domain-containing protein (putative c-di-GMP-specific phosphodiesterase class I)/GGDEF domain-containing protein
LELDKKEKYIILRFDVKNFKLVNDIFGMGIGDALLFKIGDMMRRKIIPDAIYSRIVSDKFVAFIPERYEDEFVELLMKTPLYADRNANYQVYLYIGIYKISDRTIPVTMMSDRANIALSTIKSNRFVRLSIYDESMYKDIVHEGTLSTELTSAIDNEELKVFLQPQVSCDGMVVGAEALVRWLHPTRGLLGPIDFLPIFEKNYQIVEIDRYVWEQACKLLHKWNELGYDNIHISVNISPRDFECIDVYRTLIELVDKYKLKPNQLRVEITETTIMHDPEKQIEIIGKLRRAKFYVEMDDFGSGYSSLGMLKDIELDAIKLDMRFLSKGVDNVRARKVIKLMVKLIKELEMTAIAEGVETQEEVDYLTEIGCDVFQGFHFSKPIPVEEFESRYMCLEETGT